MKNLQSLSFVITCAAALLAGCSSLPGPIVLSPGSQQDVAAEQNRLQLQAADIVSGLTSSVPVKAGELIHIEDEVTIQIWLRDKVTQFAGFPVKVTVPDTGEIFIPNIGVTRMVGRSDADIRNALVSHFDRILKDSTIVVSHTTQKNGSRQGDAIQASRRIAILGWIKGPGVYPLEQKDVTVREILAVAGDVQDFAKRSKIYLVRGSVTNPQVLLLDYDKIVTGKDLSQNLVLQHNDAIYIPPVKMWRTYDFIRTIMLPVTAIRDAIWMSTTSVTGQ